ncbi:hypothetical protein ABW21_db0208279 [Orbilia brochopaga]|nr:hypothetical protein ABW21_db0208279 [Drechslerella brochopaga]
MNRVAGMTRLEVRHMCPRRGGKIAPGWFRLAEGDLVYLDYPPDKIPLALKQRCEREAAQLAPSSLAARRPKAAIPIVSPNKVAPSELRSLEDTLIDLSVNENERSIGSILDLDLLSSTAPDENLEFGCISPQVVPQPVKEAPGLLATDSGYDASSEGTASSLPQTTNRLIRIVFSFWFGKEYTLAMHPEGRIADVAPLLNAVLRQASVTATPEQLSYSVSHPDHIIEATDKIGSIFPHRPAEANIIVSVKEESEGRATIPVMLSESLI